PRGPTERSVQIRAQAELARSTKERGARRGGDHDLRLRPGSAGAFPDEPARLSGEVDAIRRARADRDPFLHEPAVAWVEVLGLPGAHQLGDALARELHDERAVRGHEREELALHLQGEPKPLPPRVTDRSLANAFTTRANPSSMAARSFFVRVVLTRA